jgi:hypothetical protein
MFIRKDGTVHLHVVTNRKLRMRERGHMRMHMHMELRAFKLLCMRERE